MKSSEVSLITLTWKKLDWECHFFFLENFPSLWSTPNYILPSERKWLFWKLPFKQQCCFFSAESCSCALQTQSMSAFSTLFLPFEVSVGAALSLNHTPWHFHGTLQFSKLFHSHYLIWSCDNPLGAGQVSLSPFYRWEIWDSEKWKYVLRWKDTLK